MKKNSALEVNIALKLCNQIVRLKMELFDLRIGNSVLVFLLKKVLEEIYSFSQTQ